MKFAFSPSIWQLAVTVSLLFPFRSEEKSANAMLATRKLVVKHSMIVGRNKGGYRLHSILSIEMFKVPLRQMKDEIHSSKPSRL